jgi:hypothetical protein
MATSTNEYMNRQVQSDGKGYKQSSHYRLVQNIKIVIQCCKDPGSKWEKFHTYILKVKLVQART